MGYILFYLITFALIILNIEILSLFKMISFLPLLILTIVEILIFIPKIKLPRLNFDKKFLILISALIFSLSISFILCLTSPPNEADASSYHCVRALFWAADGFIHQLNISDIRANCFPINSEIVYTYLLTLFKTDSIFSLLSFFSYFALIISSYKIMEFYNISYDKRIWAIFIFSSFPCLVSQISSTQTDIVVAALLSISFCLVLKKMPFLSSLAFAIALGVKTTAFMAGLPLIIYFLFILRKDFIKYILFLILNFTVFSSYNYILNFINYGNFFGGEIFLNSHSIYFENLQTFFVSGFSTLIKYIFQFFDFSALTIFYFLSPVYDFCFNSVFNFFHINPYYNSNGELPVLNIGLFEQSLGFGILGILALIPSFIISFFNKTRIFSILLLSQILILSFSTLYFPTSIRFFVSFSFVLIPILSVLYKKGSYTFLINVIAVFYLIYTPLNLPQRPFFKIISKFQKDGVIKTIDNIRNLNYDFYLVTKRQSFLADELLKYCKGKKVALFLNSGFMIYPIQYKSFKKEYEAHFLNIFDDNKLDNYDFIVFEDNIQQSTNFIHHFETKDCKGSYLNKKQIGITCSVNKDSFKMFEFLPFVELNYQGSELLKRFKTDKDSTFYLLKKNVTNY